MAPKMLLSLICAFQNVEKWLAALLHGVGMLHVNDREAGIACWWSAGLMLERLRVQTQQEQQEEFSSPEWTVRGDSC